MKLLENLKLDKWYGIVLYLGAMMMAASLYFKVDFIEEKHLFGLGIGLVLIGLAYWISERYLNQIAYNGILSTQIIKHNPISIILLIIGVLLVTLFGFLVVKGLI